MRLFSRILGLCFLLYFKKSEGNVGDRAMAECRRQGEAMVECQRLLFHSKQRVPADILEFPHMVMVGFDPQHDGEIVYNCGGSLISPLWVLSAAHCIGDTRTGPPVKARLGTTTLEDEELEEDVIQERNLVELIRHPDYKPPVKYNDIALMRMDKPISDLGQFIKIACLKMTHTENITTARASGFGKTSYDNTGGSLTMMHVDLDIIPQAQCNTSLRPMTVRDRRVPFKQLQFTVFYKWSIFSCNLCDLIRCGTSLKIIGDHGHPETIDCRKGSTDRKTMMRRGGVLKQGIISSQICAGDLANGGKDTCQGDSGGPLQVFPKNPDCRDTFFLYEILGVTSFGRFCGFKNSPGVYTRVSEFMGWIEDIVWPVTTETSVKENNP